MRFKDVKPETVEQALDMAFDLGTQYGDCYNSQEIKEIFQKFAEIRGWIITEIELKNSQLEVLSR